MDYLIQCVMMAFYAIHFSPFFIHTSFFKFVQVIFIFLLMLFSVLMIQTVKYMYYTSHRPPTQTCTHHSYQEIQNIVLVSLQAMLMHENGTSMQLFFLICIKIKTQTKYDIWTQIIFLIYISIVTEEQSYINSYHFSDINFFQHFYFYLIINVSSRKTQCIVWFYSV